MQAWVAWLIAAGILGILEAVAPVLVFGMLAIAALAGLVLALLGSPFGWQLLGFAIAAIATLGFVRPVVRRYTQQRLPQRTGLSKLVGEDALVVERVDAHSGRVKLRGEIWSARAYDPTLVLEPGCTVQVIEIDGATALVYGMGTEIGQ
ncbi:MAG: NfeD family protein [Streptosporangiales bacterium]|nr:NfeD family protein [Streptosporangiales bacterium]MBO0890067.1 NfeD family protein [Acidothermales bacterium]